MPTPSWHVSLAAAKRLALRFPGVSGVDYGYKYRTGERTSGLCVRFHVAQKLPLDALRPHELLPAELGSIACDVLQTRYAPRAAQRSHSDRVRPGIGAGTLGAIVRDAGDGRFCLLSNWHVLCGGAGAQRGEPVFWPGAARPRTEPAQAIAALERWINPKQGCDAAIAVLSAAMSHADAFGDIGVRIGGLEEPRLGLALAQSGAASGISHALVDGVEGMFELDFGAYGDRKHWMNGFRLVPNPRYGEHAFGMGGDSGAVWINQETQRAVALQFASNDGAGAGAGSAVAHPLSRIFELLHLTS
jgi:hypothetical protein